MQTTDYEREVLRTAGSENIVMAALGLAGETGEVVELVKKEAFHGRARNRARLVEELGDVLWYLTALRLFAGISHDEVVEANVAKLRARHPDGFKPDYSNRDE